MTNCTGWVTLITEYLSSQFSVQPLDDNDCLIVTPYQTADAANVELYVSKQGDIITLSDEGEALNQLFVNGLTVEGNPELLRRVALLADINGVNFHLSKLFISATPETFGEAAHNLATVIAGVSHLINKKSHRLRLNFNDRVEKFLVTNRIKYEPKREISGATKAHTIPFFVNSGRNVLITPLSATTLNSALGKVEKWAYRWGDIRNVVGDSYKYTAVLDDSKPEFAEIWQNENITRILDGYTTHVFKWKTDTPQLLQLLTE